MRTVTVTCRDQVRLQCHAGFGDCKSGGHRATYDLVPSNRAEAGRYALRYMQDVLREELRPHLSSQDFFYLPIDVLEK